MDRKSLIMGISKRADGLGYQSFLTYRKSWKLG